VVRLLRALTDDGPVLWVVEDLHLASADALRRVPALARAAAGHRLLFVVTARSGADPTTVIAMSRLPTFARIDLGRLDEAAVRALVTAWVGDAVVGERLARVVGPRADGVALFVVELLRDLERRGLLTRGPSGAALGAGALSNVGPPRALRDLLRTRLAAVAPADRTILDLGAVEGVEFDPDLLARARGASRLEALEALGRLERGRAARGAGRQARARPVAPRRRGGGPRTRRLRPLTATTTPAYPRAVRRLLPLAVVLFAAGLAVRPGPARAADAPVAEGGPDVARLLATVRARTAADLAGVGYAADRERAAAWLDAALREAGARPVPGRDGGVVTLPPKASAGLPLGRNVVGWVPGTVPGEHVVLVAAYDGRPPTATETFLAADGRGTGLAAVLEVVRLLAAGPTPRRGVFVALVDLSDHGEAGARALAAMPGPAGSKPVVAVVAERLGRSLGDAMPGALFVFGAERGTGLASLVEGLGVPAGVVLRPLALDLHAEPTSSALPFEEAGWPTLLVTAGASKDDGTPRDVGEALQPAALVARTGVLLDLVRRVADVPVAPTLVAEPAPRVEEARTLRTLVADVLARAGTLGLDPRRVLLVRALLAHLDEAVADGRVTPGERLTARVLALQVFAALQNRDR